MKRGKTFIVSGPSGVGKSTVLKALLERRRDVYFSVSATTREMRPGEEDGVHYHFLEVDTFRQWIARGEFWSTRSTWATSTEPPSGMWTRPWTGERT